MSAAADPEPDAPSTDELEALVAAASPEALRRALRIVLGAGEAYWERDFVAGTMWYSPTFFRHLGLPDGQHERERINARVHPDDRAAFEAVYAKALQSGGSFAYDVRYLDLHGRYRWARATGRVWIDTDGRPRRLIGMMNKVHAEKQAQLDALEAEARYQRALDAAAEAHFERVAGTDELFVSANLPRLLGHPEGTPAPDAATYLSWVHPDDRAGVRDRIHAASFAEGAWEATYRLRQADGSWRWFRSRGRTLRDAQGRLRMTGMLGDVHQQVLDREELDAHRHRLAELVAQRTDRLDAALVQAERASRAKSEFLAHMSHELRTPLNGLLGLTELALRVAEQPAQRRYLEVALGSGRALLQLINEVLDFSRLEAGGVQLADEAFDLADTLAEVMRALMPSVRSKGLTMRYDWVGEPTQVRGDPARVRQIVTNLAGNAAKFTRRGHVALRAELHPQAQDRARVEVRVEDSGPGIPDAERERLFDAFVQGDASLTREHGGTGLGLTIARRLARAMDGDVTLERSGADGSTFLFAWPVALAPGASALPRPAPGRAWLVNRPLELAEWLAHRIERLGWQAELLPDLDAVRRRAATAPAPDLLVVAEQALDPSADLAALQRALPTARIALLVRPDWNQPAHEQQAIDLQMHIAVTPLTPRDLVAMLSRSAAPSAAAPAPDADRHATSVLVVEDNAVNRMIAEEFLRQLGHAPCGAADGAAAIAACSAAPPALVLMDLQMPVMDGFEATRRLRALQANGRLARFPIVALTAHAGEADRAAAAAAGMDDYLTKPLLLDTLRDALARWLPAPVPLSR